MNKSTCLLGLLCIAACQREPSTIAVFDPAASDFWALPFPSELRRRADGTLGFSAWPQYGERSPLAIDNELVHMWLAAADRRLHDGFGLTNGIFFPTSGAIDPKTLPQSPRESLANDASAFLIDVDPTSPERGKRRPVAFSFRTKRDRYAPANLIAATQVFGFPRRPATEYALVLTDGVRDAAGEPLGRSRAFDDQFEDRAHFANLIATLEQSGVELDRVVGAAVFRTLDPNAIPLRLADWTESLPAPELAGPFRVAENYESYQVLTATYSVPVIQRGARPYSDAGEGWIAWGEDGKPIVQGRQDVRLSVAIPKQPMPANGFPVTMYLHGSGGEWYEGIDRGPAPYAGPRGTVPDPPRGTGPAEWLARRGVALVGFDFALHGNRNDPPDRTGLLLYNLFGNIEATLDNYYVSSMELLVLSRLLTTLSIDAGLAQTLDAGGAAGNRIHFDSTKIMGMGHSMGSTLGVPWAALDPRIRGFFVSGGGGTLIDVAVNAHHPIVLRPFVERLLEMREGEELDITHPLLHAFQNLWDLADPSVRARHVAREPYAGRSAKHVFMTVGVRDGYFAPGAQVALANALGVSLYGDAVETTLPEALALAEKSTQSYPATGAPVIAAAHYEVPHELGHYVAFDLEPARMQYTCFLATAGELVPPPGTLDAPCR